MRRPRLSLGSSLAFGAAALVLLTACEHAPSEDFPPRPGPTSLSASPVSAPAVRTPESPAPALSVASPAPPAAAAPSAPSARCIIPTPAQPPPAVAPGPAAGCPRDPEALPPAQPTARVVFPGAGGASVDVEVVRTPHDTQRGLMYRTAMAEGRGMLFDLGTREDHKFWMHNTCIPLDLLYIDDDGFIVGIVENAPTLNDEARGVGCPSSHVLEVNAGWSRRHGVKAGQFVKLP